MFGKLSALAGFAACFAVGWAIGSRDNTQTLLSFVDVGQGDCTVFQHDGYTVVIDTAGKTPDFDAGERLAVPAMRRLGVTKIDLLIITHPDSDHVGGIRALSKQFRIGKVVAASHFKTHYDMTMWLNSARFGVNEVEWLKGAAHARLGAATVEITNPGWPRETPDNDGSLIVSISLGNGSALITGDASQEVEGRLAGRGDWNTEILKVGHHGSQTSTSTKWLIETSPEFAVVSCGRGNRYGHPHKSVLNRLKEKKIPYFRTDRDGTVSFTIGPNGFEPLTSWRTY